MHNEIVRNRIKNNKIRIRETNKLMAVLKAQKFNLPLKKVYRYVIEYKMLEKQELNRILADYKAQMKKNNIERLDLVDAYQYIKDKRERFYSKFKLDDYITKRAETDEILKELSHTDEIAATEFTTALRVVVYRGRMPVKEFSAETMIPNKYRSCLSDISMS